MLLAVSHGNIGTSVDDKSFGSALADCVLVPDEPEEVYLIPNVVTS